MPQSHTSTRRKEIRKVLIACFCVGFLPFNILLSISALAEPPSDKLIKALAFKPRQSEVNYEQVKPEAVSDCTIEEVTREDGKGFLVTGPGAVPLRWFVDTNKDNRLDRWCYFNAGVEVYRESDTDFNETADEYRWLSTEGLRWGNDKDEDGEIDAWSMISAEEATAELVRAVSERDAKRFSRLLISEAELKSLGLGKEKTDEILQTVSDAKKLFVDWTAGQNTINRQTKWANFGADKPGIVPAGTSGSKKDIVVYENVVALLEEAGKAKQLQVGTMIQVGPTWRLLDLPKISGAADTKFFPAAFQPRGINDVAADNAVGLSKEAERLFKDLQAIDEKLQSAKADEKAGLQAKRADALERLVAASKDEERTSWIQQFADTVGAVAQTGEYPDGVERLRDFIGRLAKESATKDEIAYVVFRTITADNNVRMQQPKADYDKLQKEHISELEEFVSKYPTSPDAAEAMASIALAAEFAGEGELAAKWYSQAASKFGNTLWGKKSQGALKRLNLVGNAFALKGKTLEGTPIDTGKLTKAPVIYHCWASWCDGCMAEMRGLRELQSKYANKLNIVGLNFDTSAKLGIDMLKQNNFKWPHLYDEGGLDSNLAVNLGIVTLPVTIVVDQNGKVVKTGAHWTELDGIISDLLR